MSPWESSLSPLVEACPEPVGLVKTTELVAACMKEFRCVLSQSEIRELAFILRALRFKSLQLDEFCTKLEILFGDDKMCGWPRPLQEPLLKR